MVMYDAEPDIRHFYRAQIRALKHRIDETSRRDPVLHKLHAEKRLIESKLASIADTHGVITGAMADYGIW